MRAREEKPLPDFDAKAVSRAPNDTHGCDHGIWQHDIDALPNVTGFKPEWRSGLRSFRTVNDVNTVDLSRVAPIGKVSNDFPQRAHE